MPNDPRVKFKKKIHDSSRNVIYFGGNGSGGMRSIFEDGTPPPDAGGEPPIGGGGEGQTPRDTQAEPIPQPLKPSLNPGEITGITIGTLAGAAALEVARRAYLEYLEEERKKGRSGAQIVSQSDRPIKARRGGNIFEIQSRVRVGRAISRGINTAIQSSFEMVTPSSAYRPIPIQSEIVLPSGATTPRAPAPAPAPDLQRATTRATYTSRDTAPDRLVSVFPDTTGALGVASPPAPTPAPIRKPNVALDLQKELEIRQLEIQNPNISEARTKTLQSEIRVLERQIETNARIRAQRTRPAPAPPPPQEIEMSKLRPQAPAPAPPPETPSEPIASRTRSKAGKQLNEQLKLIKQQEDLARIKLINSKQQRLSENIEIANADLAKVNVPRQEVYLKGRLTANLNKLEKTVAEIELKLLNVNMSSERRTALIAQQERYRRQIAAIDEAQSSGINKTVTTEINTSVHTPANDNIRATQPTREFESRLRPVIETEMQPVRREYFAEIGEIVQAAMQQMGSRKPLAKVGQTPNFEGELIGPQFSERMAAGVGIDLNAPRPLVENRPEPQRPTTIDPFEAEPERPPAPAPVERPVEIGMELQDVRGRPAERTALERAQIRAARTPEERAAIYRAQEAARTSAPIERPAPAQVPTTAPPQERAPVVATETAVDRFNKIYDTMVEKHLAEGFEIPTAPEGMTGIESKKYIMDEIINESVATERPLLSGDTNPVEITPEQAFAKVQAKYDKALNDPTTQRPVEAITPEESIGIAPTKKGKGKLTKKTGLLATEEQRLRPTALAGEAQARVRAAAPAEARTTAPVAEEISVRRATSAPEARAAAPAPEIVARRQLSAAPELTAPRPAAPGERASITEKISFFDVDKPVAPPAGEAAPSAPPSAPESEVATPREGVVTERTATERASFAEEVRLGMNKKIPARQKAKYNIGKPKTTPNPLERFVAPQFRNVPNVEIHPGAKGFRGALSELSARVPRLVPTRQVLLNAGGNLAAEGGGMVAGFYAGSAAGKAMSDYFATHPPKNRGEEFGQALATSMVALGVGNLTAKVVTYVIKQGVRAVLMGEVSGSISSGGAAGASAILEAALFATVATTTQFYTTKALEDAGYNHSTSRGLGSAAATEALLGLEFVAFMAKGGPLNPFAIGSFVASELFILGFGIWSFFEETEEGRLEDLAEESQREAAAAEAAAARVERQLAIDKINRTNSLRAGFMVAMETHDYDFDKLYATLSDEDKVAMGISTPESRSAFQRQVESAFDPFGSFAEPSPGIVAPEVLSPIEQQRRDVFNSYINWYLGELRGETQPPFNFNDTKVQELNEYSGGTWQSAAAVTATTNHMQAERVHPLIINAQNEIINAFHNERKTIEEMPPDVVRYANLDSNFRDSYEAYIVTEAQAQILIEFNRTQYTYNDVDPKLLEIADRDPTFRATADTYYQTLANQARDLNLSISEVARLNALMENEQAIEIGKLNDARNKIIERNMAENQAAIDAYNANIIREINIYGDNFEAIIRNINDQALLSGHTFMYATTKADLYRQLHMEMPELELVDPVDEIDQPNATWHPGKGRKVGDTALYGYRYNLTDEQNQELEDMIARGEITRQDAENQANFIRERDRYLYEETDKERADALKMSLADYYAKYGMPIDPYTMPIVDFKLEGKPPTNGRVRMPDGSIRTYRNGVLVNIDTAEIITETPPGTYNPALPQQPDGEIRMPDGSIRTYKDGKVTFVVYNTSTPGNERLTPDQINAQIDAMRGPTYQQLQEQYPLTYNNLLEKHANDPNKDSIIEAALKRAYATGFDEVNAWANKGDDSIDTGANANLTPVTPPQPVSTVLFNGERKMPDGTSRTYKAGKVTSIGYPEGYPLKQMLDKNGLANLNNQEGLYYDPNPPTPVTPETPVTPTTPTEPLKNGVVKMPDGSTRTYQNGIVIFVSYQGSTRVDAQLTPKQINEEEGIRNATYTGTTLTPVTPVAPTAPLKQGAVKMPDGSKRIYIDGKVVSVAYPDGTSGPTINQINAAEGTKTATPDSNNPVNPTAPVNPGGLPVQYVSDKARIDAEEASRRGQTLQQFYIDNPGRAPTETPANEPLPFVPGARSFEYADSGTQATTPAPAPTTTTNP